MKIILVIFGLVAFMFFIQYTVVTVSSENKKEHYLNYLQESFEEEPNEKAVGDSKKKVMPKKKAEAVVEAEEEVLPEKPEKAEKSTSQQAFRIRLLDSIDKAFAEIPNARELRDHKPMVFDELSKKEDMAKVKDEDAFDAQVKDHVEKHLAAMAPAPKKKSEGSKAAANFVAEEQIEKLTELKDTLDETVKAINGVLSNMGVAGVGTMGGPRHVAEWSALLPSSKPVEAMSDEKTQEPEGPLDMGVDKRRPANKNGVIEGFENVRSRSYALF
jgi:hypothetical protein